MNKRINKLTSLLVAVLLLFSNMSAYNAEESNEIITNNEINNGIVYGNPDNCTIGTSTIADCFTDLVWANAVAKKVGATYLGVWIPAGFVTAIPQYDVDIILTDLMISQITEINGENDLIPFVYKDDEGISYMPKMDGLGLFTSLKVITNFRDEYSNNFASIAWTDAGVTDFSKWSEAPNLEEISDIDFNGGDLTTIDISSWGNLSKLELLFNINFSNNQLVHIGDLGEWTNLTNLKTMEQIRFFGNQLTNIGDLGQWSELLSLTTIEYIDFSNNYLVYIGDLGEWSNLSNLTKMYFINFTNNSLTDIGNLGRWSNLTSLTQLNAISFHNNQLTNIGDLGEWSNLINLTSFGDVNFSLNQLTDIGDLGRWSNLTKLTELNYFTFYGNQLTDIGDLGRWSEIPNLQDISYLDFGSNEITNIGDLGKWGNSDKLMRIWMLDFSSNKLTDIGDLGNLGNLSTLLTLRTLNFSNNQLTDIGDIQQWQNIPNISSFVRDINFSNNNIETIALTDSFASQTFPIYSSLFNFQLQTYQREGFYFNRRGLTDADTLNITVAAHNPFNYPSGEYGAYTLTPDINEQYKDNQNNILTVSDGKLALPVKLNDVAATYIVMEKNHIPVDYSATIAHPIYWFDLGIDATDFEIELNDILPNLVNDNNAITYASASVQLVDENNQTQNVIPTVNQEEYQAIKDTTIPGVFPLTFSYAYQNSTVTKTINVTVNETIPDELIINANDFSIELKEVMTLTNDLAKLKANVAAENVTQSIDITNKVNINMAELEAIQQTNEVGVYPLTFIVIDNGQKVSRTVNVTIYDTSNEYSIHANDAMLEISKYWDLKNKGTLEQYILDITNAEAFNETLGIEVTPIFTDLSDFDNIEIVDGAKATVTFSYVDTNQNSKNTNQVVSTTAVITLYEDDPSIVIPPEEDTLVETGERSQEILIGGMILTILSIISLYFSRKLRKIKKNLG